MLAPTFMDEIKPYLLSANVELQEAHLVTSTNDWAWEFYDSQRQQEQASSLSNTLFLAESQQKGRGTHNRNWSSPEGSGIYASLLYPIGAETPSLQTLEDTMVTVYTEVAALALWSVLTSIYPSLTHELKIRRVNDLYIHHCKLGGVLVESRINAQGRLQALVTGFGINILPDGARQVMDERNAPLSLYEALHPDERADMMNKKQLAYLLAKGLCGLYTMLETGKLMDYEHHLQRIRGPII
jgi:biotin-(acetyl-CoA carboxylase) ligase